MITPQEVQELLNKATPGPWMHDPEGFMGCGQVYTMGDHVEGGSIAGPTGDLYPRSGYSPKDDMLLIARTREISEAYLRVAATLRRVSELATDWECAVESDEFAYRLRLVLDK